MSGQQKRGFRLPWNPERGSDEGGLAAIADQETLDSAPATTKAIQEIVLTADDDGLRDDATVLVFTVD